MCTRVKKMVSPSFFVCYMRRVWYQWQIICRQNSTIWMHWMGIHGVASHLPVAAPPHFFVLISGVRFPGINGTKLLAASAKMAPTLIWCVYAPIIQNIVWIQVTTKSDFKLFITLSPTQWFVPKKVLICKLPWKMATRHLHFSSALFISFPIWGAAELC